MVQRVLIQGGNAAAMIVSMPGVEVTTANVDQTVFDSRWSGVTPYITGQLASVNDSVAQNNFGETLAFAPMFMGGIITGTTTGNQLTPKIYRGGGQDQWWYVEIGTSYIQFRANFLNQTGTLHYTLYKRVGG